MGGILENIQGFRDWEVIMIATNDSLQNCKLSLKLQTRICKLVFVKDANNCLQITFYNGR